jgi:AcrR family transcriptional regulator
MIVGVSGEFRQRKLPIQVRGEVRVRALLEAAEVVFADQGYDGATMSAIAACADAPIGSLYQFFPSKEAIGVALIDQYLELLAREWSKLRAGLRKGSIAKLCRGLTLSTRKFIETSSAYRALDSVAARATLQPRNRAALLAELQILIAKVAPNCSFVDRDKIAVVMLQLVKSEYALDRIVGPELVRQAREEMCFVMESYLTQRLKAFERSRPPASRRSTGFCGSADKRLASKHPAVPA